MAQQGRRVTSCDPLYQFSADMEALRRLGFAVEIRQVGYEFQKGGNQMLRAIAKE